MLELLQVCRAMVMRGYTPENIRCRFRGVDTVDKLRVILDHEGFYWSGNDHYRIESLFKALPRLDMAIKLSEVFSL